MTLPAPTSTSVKGYHHTKWARWTAKSAVEGGVQVKVDQWGDVSITGQEDDYALSFHAEDIDTLITFLQAAKQWANGHPGIQPASCADSSANHNHTNNTPRPRLD